MNEENKESIESSEEELNEAVSETVEENTEEITEENAEESIEEIVEESVDAAESEMADDSAEEVAFDAENEENAAEQIDGADDIIGETVKDVPTEEPKKLNKGLIIGIIAAVVVVAAVIVVALFGKNLFNKYNRMGYIDVSGKTIAEIADSNGYELADFLAQYDLPADMPGNTSESAAYYNIPCKKIAEMYGMDLATLKETLKLGDDITEDTAWGIAEGETTVSAYVGEDNIDDFKAQYGFGDDITGETKWKEIRNIIDQQSRDARIEAEKQAKEAEKATEAPEATEAASDDDSAEATEAPAATEAAKQ